MTDLSKLAKKLNEATSIEEAITIVNGEVQLGTETAQQYVRHDRERTIRNRRLYKKEEIPANIFPTIAVLVSVKRDWEYELWLLTEDIDQWKESKRSWNVSYVKSIPRDFRGHFWTAWGYYGFKTKGIFSGAEYGFVDTIPTLNEVGDPVLLNTKTLDVNQQLGISTPLFLNVTTDTEVDLGINDAWWKGFYNDSYATVTHLYEDKYGNRSLADERNAEEFGTGIWYGHPVSSSTEITDSPSKVYRYVFTDSTDPIDFDALNPIDYTTVIINPSESASVETSEEEVEDEEWQRDTPETCIPPEFCVTATRTIVSDERSFGSFSPWNVNCWESGELRLTKEGETIAALSVSAFPVSIEWATVPDRLFYKFKDQPERNVERVSSLRIINDNAPGSFDIRYTIVGVPDTLKNSPSSVEGGNSTTAIITSPPPASVATETIAETRWKWATENVWYEINSTIAGYGIDYIDGADAGLQYWPVKQIHSGFGYQTNSAIVEASIEDWRIRDLGERVGGYFYIGIDQYGGWISPTEGAAIQAAMDVIDAAPNDEGRDCNYLDIRVPLPSLGAIYNLPAPPRVGIVNWRHCYIGYSFDAGRWFVESKRIVPRGWVRSAKVYPYVVFANGVRHYGAQADYNEANNNRNYSIQVLGSTDTKVTIGGTEYFYASPPSVGIQYQTSVVWTLAGGGNGQDTDFGLEYAFIAPAKRLRVYEDGVMTHEEFYSEQYPVSLFGRQNIAEYKKTRHVASIAFFKDGAPYWYYKRLVGNMTGETIVQDCNGTGRFVYDEREIEDKIGITTLTEEDSDKTVILVKHIKGRAPEDEILDSEVTPELRVTDVYAGAKIFSAINDRDDLILFEKESSSNPLDEPTERPIISMENDWDLPGAPHTILNHGTGATVLFKGHHGNRPPADGGVTWKYRVDNPFSETIEVDRGGQIQWTNHHEYFTLSKVSYQGESITDRLDEGVEYRNGWEPLDLLALRGYLPSGEFRSLEAYHEATVKLTFEIKGMLDTVGGVNKEPLFFVFAYGAHYAVFGKVNDGLDSDNDTHLLRIKLGSPLVEGLNPIFNLKRQIEGGEPYYIPEVKYDRLMTQNPIVSGLNKYSWGGFKNYIAKSEPGLSVNTFGISKILPQILLPLPFPDSINPGGITSLYKLWFKSVDLDQKYTIAVNGISINATAANRAALISRFMSIIPPSILKIATVTASASTIVFEPIDEPILVSVSPTDLFHGLEVEVESFEPKPSVTRDRFIIHFPGCNPPYTLSIDGEEYAIPVASGMDLPTSIETLSTELDGFTIELRPNENNPRWIDLYDVSSVEDISEREGAEYNAIQIEASIELTESQDRSWRSEEIIWSGEPDEIPDVGQNVYSPLSKSLSANIALDLDYEGFNYSKYPYTKIDRAKNPLLFIPSTTGESYPTALFDRDFIKDDETSEVESIVVDYSEDNVTWKEITLQAKQILPEWLSADRVDITVIAISPAIVSCQNGKRLQKEILGEPNYE